MMTRSRRIRSFVVPVLALFSLASAALAQNSTADTRGNTRIAGRIVESDLVMLEGNLHPLARLGNDHGAVADETRLDRMVLVLEPSAAQQAELDALTAAQHDPESPLYHQWLTPEEYGRRFGASDGDLARLTAWLEGHGFAVEPVPAGRRSIIFSGTAGQVAEAFHTEIHQYEVNGAAHIANAQDPQIPRALAPVVAGVLSLHDFRRQSATRRIAAVSHPENSQGSTHYLFPADYATIYDLSPQYNAGHNGSGVSIAIVGRSNINLSDVSSFRSYTGLPANQPTVILEGSNPGLVPGDQDESTLDVEWSGATAPGAAVKFVVAASTSTSDGVDLSAQYIVNHKTANIMSTSYGSCEAYMGSSELAFYNSLWQQAASEGISSFVSSGDSGAAGCDNGSSSKGTRAGVNGLCSSPYSTCVGGTEFNEGTSASKYWSSTNGAGGGSALSYIPEKVWNESASDGGSGLWASTGGVSIAYAQPSWQKGIPGASSSGMRAVPDVALTAASHDGYLINEDGTWYVIAGTSAASPSFAGIMAVVEQKLAGAAQGNANPTLYSLLNASQNPFHATPAGNNSVPGVTGFTASGAAYNLATGLGSVDANLLANEWPANGVVQKGFTLKASAASESLLPGKSVTFTVGTAVTGGFTGSISFKATAPSGVTVSFNPASVAAGVTTTATLTVSSSAAAQTGNVTITGTSGSTIETTTLALTVQAAPTLTIGESASKLTVARGASGTLQLTTTTGGSFSGAVSLAVTGLPSGVTATWSAASYAPTGNGSHVSTLTIKPGTAAALATSSLTITATGDGITAMTPASLQVVPAPGVTVALLPAAISMSSMATQSLTATVTPVGGVSLTSSAAYASFKVSGLPSGISGNWGAATLTASGTLQAKLTLTGSTTAVSTSTQPVIAIAVPDSITGKTFTASATAALTVTHTPATLALAPAMTKVAVGQGHAATLQVTTTTGGSFTGAVVLAVSGLPAGVTAAWTNGSFTRAVAGSTVSTLTLQAASNAALTTASLRITASGDGVSAQTAVPVQVTTAPAISLSLSSAQISMKPHAARQIVVTLTPVSGAKLPSTAANSSSSFQIDGLPTGFVAIWGVPAVSQTGAVQVTLTLQSGSAATGSSNPAVFASARDAATGALYTRNLPVKLAVSQ